jgi:acetyltransferase-like isoleucine patch superfamily enzyme
MSKSIINKKKKLSFNSGGGFLRSLKDSSFNNNYYGFFGVSKYMLVRLKNFYLHKLAQSFPFHKTRAHLHGLRGVNISKSAQIGGKVWIDEAFPKYITIKEGSAISIGCKILAHSIPPVCFNNKFHSYVAPVVIEKNVWVGAYSIILAGVTIGEGSVVSVGSIVTKTVPPNSIVQGNPAKVVGKLNG